MAAHAPCTTRRRRLAATLAGWLLAAAPLTTQANVLPALAINTDANAAAASTSTQSAADPERSVFAYGGVYSDTRLIEILRLDIDPRRSFLAAVGVSQRLYRFDDRLDLEAEVLIARHAGRQHHTELAAALSLRWHRFPWDDVVNTSMAYGHGPSFATSPPPLEASHKRDPRQRLLFMVAEVTLAPPDQPPGGLEALVRIHHRSGVFRLLSSGSGSNFVSFGLRYRY